MWRSRDAVVGPISMILIVFSANMKIMMQNWQFALIINHIAIIFSVNCFSFTTVQTPFALTCSWEARKQVKNFTNLAGF